MVIAEARVETDRPARYLAQLCQHLGNKGRHLGTGKGRQLGHRRAATAASGATIRGRFRPNRCTWNGLRPMGWSRSPVGNAPCGLAAMR